MLLLVCESGLKVPGAGMKLANLTMVHIRPMCYFETSLQSPKWSFHLHVEYLFETPADQSDIGTQGHGYAHT